MPARQGSACGLHLDFAGQKKCREHSVRQLYFIPPPSSATCPATGKQNRTLTSIPLPHMNEAMIAQHAQAHQIISEGLGLTPLDEMNERLYGDDRFQRFRVPVTLIRKSFVEILARDAKSAENVVSVCASLADGVEDAEQSEEIGPAVAI